ncbi:hypothetical protein [Portibacter marinus]|uniref:hypothetical protein n=1 Tax=Portibacter marinus TaxID=2898660 RepID=UPI001F382D80|nr:hypothetical protein [Portibacter marinus]
MVLRSICIWGFILFTFTVSAQEVMFITFLQDSAAIGEQVDMVITLEGDSESITQINLQDLEDIQFFSATATQKDSIAPEGADINITDLGRWEDYNGDGIIRGDELKWDEVDHDGIKTYKNRIRMAFFDVGIYVFDGFNFTYQNRDYKTNRVLMKVTFKDYNLTVVDSTGLAPIKNIEREPLKIQDFIPYLLMVLVPALLLYFGYQYWKKRKNGEEAPKIEPIVYIPPDVKALTSLKALRQQELWQKGEIKQYQSELSHIIREYLEGRYDIHALESTTSDIIRSIKDRSFTETDQVKLRRILQISDLVKFAKAKPEVNIHEEFMYDAIEFVQRTRRSPNENGEEE